MLEQIYSPSELYEAPPGTERFWFDFTGPEAARLLNSSIENRREFSERTIPGVKFIIQRLNTENGAAAVMFVIDPRWEAGA